MGPVNKLLIEDADGASLVRRAALAALASGVVDEVVVVTGHEPARVRDALSGLPLRFTHNPEHLDGMGASLAAGARALSGWSEGAFVALGDMPAVRPEIYSALARALSGDQTIAAPTFDGRRGHPVLFGARHLDALRALQGDEGARRVVRGDDASVCLVEVDDEGVLLDVDTPEDARR